jgi:hypothetical protein
MTLADERRRQKEAERGATLGEMALAKDKRRQEETAKK